MNDETFQYMLLLRGATGPGLFCRGAGRVSIHAPLTRSNCMDFLTVTMPTRGFNTCSSCEEQQYDCPIHKAVCLFQYMLLLRGATFFSHLSSAATRFNTCSSCEEQQCRAAGCCDDHLFQYMLLLRGATFCTEKPFIDISVSIHAPLARSNSTRTIAYYLHPSFQYMLLLRGATQK